MSEPATEAPKKHKRLWLYLPWGVFVIGAIAWCIYWFALAHQMDARIAAWAAAQNQGGGEAHIGAIERRGFPAMMRYDLRDVHYAPQGRAFALETAHLTLHVNLTDPRHIYLERKAPFTLIHGAERSLLDANTAILSLGFNTSGLNYFGLEADRAVLDNPNAEGRMSIAHIVANARPDPRKADDWQIALLIDTLHVARPVEAFAELGQDMPRVEAAVVWTAAKRARFEGGELQWGAAHASVLGEIGFDDAHRLDGHLNVTTPRDALRYFPGALRAGVLLRQPTQDPVQFALEASDGKLRAEGHEVRTLAPIY